MALLSWSCTKPDQPGMRKIAALPFENLTGDASLDWIRTAGPSILAEELAGSSHVSISLAGTLADVRNAGVPSILHTTYTREHGNLRLQFSMEDRNSQRVEPVSLPSASANGSVLSAVDTLARTFDPQVRAFSTTNAAAVEAWGRGSFDQATELDPDFGAAWAARVRMLAQAGKQDEALQLADTALARKTLHSDWNRAQLRVLAATLRKDSSARAAALSEVANLAPHDPLSLATAAEAQGTARNFAASAQLYAKLWSVDHSDPRVLNSLGYAEGFAGNLDAAQKAFDEYGKLPGSQVNALDSLGEVYFLNGRFADAERAFVQEYGLDPKFLGGAAAMKAAYAHWLAGDLAGADAMVQKYVVALVKGNAGLAIWRQATWLYATGRQEQALAMLAKAPADDRIRRQVTVWQNLNRLPSTVEALKPVYESQQPAQDGVARVLYAAALVNAGKTDDARALLKRWPLPENGADPTLETIVFPKYLELRKKLQVGQ